MEESHDFILILKRSEVRMKSSAQFAGEEVALPIQINLARLYSVFIVQSS